MKKTSTSASTGIDRRDLLVARFGDHALHESLQELSAPVAELLTDLRLQPLSEVRRRMGLLLAERFAKTQALSPDEAGWYMRVVMHRERMLRERESLS